MLSRFHPISERNGRTDRQTDRQTDGQICYINIARHYADWLQCSDDMSSRFDTIPERDKEKKEDNGQREFLYQYCKSTC